MLFFVNKKQQQEKKQRIEISQLKIFFIKNV
jgi:hypothetical protein